MNNYFLSLPYQREVWRDCLYRITKKGRVENSPFFCDPAGMVGFCARRAQRALFQAHSALTDAVFYTDFIGLISEILMLIIALCTYLRQSHRDVLGETHILAGYIQSWCYR